jgi:hypothetical protein
MFIEIDSLFHASGYQLRVCFLPWRVGDLSMPTTLGMGPPWTIRRLIAVIYCTNATPPLRVSHLTFRHYG